MACGPGLHTRTIQEQLSPGWKKCEGIHSSTPRIPQGAVGEAVGVMVGEGTADCVDSGVDVAGAVGEGVAEIVAVGDGPAVRVGVGVSDTFNG